MTNTQTIRTGPMYTWVARHTGEVEHEVIGFKGSVLALLKMAEEQDAIRADLLAALKRFADPATYNPTAPDLPIAEAIRIARAAIARAKGGAA